MMGRSSAGHRSPRFAGAALCALAAISSATALAQAAPEATAPPASVAPMAEDGVIAAGTLVALRVEENLSSRTSKRGDRFPITLMNDLWLGNRIAVPAGTRGVGEVIHAAGKGFGGRAGELIVTARYLEFEGRRIRLGHFRLGAAGADNATTAIFATMAAPVAGLFVTGTSATIGLGQFAQARIAEDFPLSAQAVSNKAPATDADTQGERK